MTIQLEEALRLVRETERTDPEAIARIEMARVCADVNFAKEARRQPPQPSFAGQSPINASLIEAKERAHAEQVARDRVDHARQAASHAAAIEYLAAGQAPTNSADIRRQGRVP